MCCLHVNVTSPRLLHVHILMSLANKLLCILENEENTTSGSVLASKEVNTNSVHFPSSNLCPFLLSLKVLYFLFPTSVLFYFIPNCPHPHVSLLWERFLSKMTSSVSLGQSSGLFLLEAGNNCLHLAVMKSSDETEFLCWFVKVGECPNAGWSQFFSN